MALPFVGMSQDVTFRTQDDVDVFTATSITGVLTITETMDNPITNLTALSILTSVGGREFDYFF